MYVLRTSGAIYLALAATVVLQLSIAKIVQADEAISKKLGEDYVRDVRPLLTKYCYGCHGPDLAEAELDLASMPTLQEVRKNVRSWQKVAEMLDTDQMPPKDADQPSDAEHKAIHDWVQSYLKLEIQARAGDPGRVVLRRLSNAEYTYTLRDLTGIAELDPAKEFPVDGAAGEGFTNTGNALVMSPSLVTKYLDAAKQVSRHAVLLPDGFRFSPHTTARDWTDDTLGRIRSFYAQYSAADGGDQVNLQGHVFQTNEGGRLPVEKYVTATIQERDALQKGTKTIEQVAKESGLNQKYLKTLWDALTQPEPSLLVKDIRQRWSTAKVEDVPSLVTSINQWQRALFRFTTVGHIGKLGGPKRWLEPVTPLADRNELRFKIPADEQAKEVVLSLVATDGGDGNQQDFVVWHRPRLVAPGRPDLMLRDVRRVNAELSRLRSEMIARTSAYLAAADEASALEQANIDELAQKHQLNRALLAAWLEYLGIGSADALKLEGHLVTKITSTGGYDFVQGWGSHDPPQILANASDKHVRVPGNMKPHSVAVHPTPTLRTAVGWRSPITAKIRVQGEVLHAHPECGNGVTWILELRRGSIRRRLASGVAHGGTPVTIGPVEPFDTKQGDLLALSIGPRDRNHSCDLTQVDLKITSTEANNEIWDLARDVSGNILTGNPHTDGAGRAEIWHFYTEPEQSGTATPVIPNESVLAKWLSAPVGEPRRQLAGQLASLLSHKEPPAKGTPDGDLYRQLTSLGGPLLGNARSAVIANAGSSGAELDVSSQDIALDPAAFGRHPAGGTVDAESLCVQAPNVMQIRLPADLVDGSEFVTTGQLDSTLGREGSVQVEIRSGEVKLDGTLQPSKVTENVAAGRWTDFNRQVSFGSPVIVNPDTESRRRIEAAFEDFRQLFPAALCYTKIVPVDEVVTLTLFYREDDHLVRLMLDESQRLELDRLWDELHFVSRDALTLVDAFGQLMEFATQDADPKVFEPLRQPILDRAESFRRQLQDSEPKQLAALLEFVDQAYRRPATESERAELRKLYENLRRQELPHEDAFRLTLARILVAPAFLYRLEKPGPGKNSDSVSPWELANRLSYFLWSSQPDETLRNLAASGELSDRKLLLEQTRRMIKDAKTRRLAIEFGCQWLHINGFDKLDEKSEKHFPTFGTLRTDMYEESIQFFTHMFQTNRPVLELLNADYTFLNSNLASHYGIPGVEGPQWRQVSGVKKYARGGILTQSTTLAMQSGASRTSPILRGNWISEVLLGERLPRPPKDVPVLPDEESASQELTVRQLVEKHVSDPKCGVCHRRIDPLGFSLENFDAIGRWREKDLGERPIDTQVTTVDGAQFEGLEGLQDYMLTNRRNTFVRQFCKKLLGYALGRAVQLSDEPLLDEMRANLEAQDYQVWSAIETIVSSPQFNQIRGLETAYEDE